MLTELAYMFHSPHLNLVGKTSWAQKFSIWLQILYVGMGFARKCQSQSACIELKNKVAQSGESPGEPKWRITWVQMR